jgi:hypothetical protein
MAEPFAEFLRASLAAVRRDAPPSARAVAAALGATAVELAVDDERMVVRACPDVVVEPTGGAARSAVHVATSARALLALLDGGDELYPAIVDNRVRVRAPAGDAARLFDALRSFVEGCARTPAAPELLAAFRRRAEANQDWRGT